MKCKFIETEECIQSEAFEKWKDDKRETGFLSLGVCPECPVYNKEPGIEEVKDD